MLGLQYLALASVFVLGAVAIDRGLLVEPPAWFVNFMTLVADRISRRFGSS
jgi:hypothetical protein